ncbi:MAG: hypothetical protein JXA71_20150 [Chitinispirillaceae bacterium]|nr:hypothetical protein [Chitinispirillaceae bacterium]
MNSRPLFFFPAIGAFSLSMLLAIPRAEFGEPSPSLEVPLHHPVYHYLDMLPLPGKVGTVSLSRRPFTEAQVCSLLVFVERSGQRTDTSISRFYLRQFRRLPSGMPVQAQPAMAKLDGFRTVAYPYAVSTTSMQDSAFSHAGFSAAAVDSVSNAIEAHNATRVGLRMASSYGRALVYFDGAIATEYSTLATWDKAVDPRRGIFQTPILTDSGTPGHFMGYDLFTAYAKASLPWFDLKMGSDRISWGHADSSGLLFSGSGSPFLHLSADKEIGDLNYAFLLGKLIGDTYGERRVIYAKRVSYTPYAWLSLGFSDAVITVNRDFEPLYCFPFIPFYFTEHFLGDLDNRTMSFDARTVLRKRLVLYGELFLDDISNLLGMFSNDSWGDKWATVAGAKIIDPVPLLAASMLRLEYTQIEPWVYTTSSRPGLEANNYPIHFGRVLGNRLGPHARSFGFEWSGRYDDRTGGSIAVTRYWKGRGPGSSIFDRNVQTDTVNGTIVYNRMTETKEYRFQDFDRDRSALSASVDTWFHHRMRAVVNGDFAIEREPVSLRLFRAGLSFQVHY